MTASRRSKGKRQRRQNPEKARLTHGRTDKRPSARQPFQPPSSLEALGAKAGDERMRRKGAAAALAAWRGFWFTPHPTSTLALIRIAYGIVALGAALTLAPDLFDFFTADGVVPDHPEGPWTKGVLSSFSGRGAVLGLYGLLLAGAVCLILGFHAQLAALIVLVAWLSFHRRNPYIWNSGDGLMRVFALFLALSPSDASLSLRRWLRARETFWEFPKRALWGQRLMQIQLTVLYAVAVWSKFRSDGWNDGTAISYTLRLGDLTRIQLPEAISTSLLLSNVLTYSVLAAEITILLTLWKAKTKPRLLFLGLALHLGIDLILMVGFFSLTIFVGYLAFLPGEGVSEWLLKVQQRLKQSQVQPLRRLALAGAQEG